MSAVASVVLKPHKRGTFFARHPWVLDKSIANVPQHVDDGDPVNLVLPDGRWIAQGIYNSQSRIRVRLYSWSQQQPVSDLLWHERLALAVQLRQRLGTLNDRGATRLVYSEADGMSGLIVDKYARHLVVQFTARAMQMRQQLLLEWLAEHLQPESIQVRIDPRVAKAEGLEPQSECAYGTPPSDPVTFQEQGVTLQIDLVDSQKTGYYLDQRDNRQAAAHYATGGSVLDICCYLGGFALAAARAGAQEVLAVDSSERALEQARRHAEINQLSSIEFQQGDCFAVLEQLVNEQRRFDTVILDPPRFASGRNTLQRALHAYHRLNKLALELIPSGGYLVSCSCSALVTKEDFRQILVGASRKAQRDLQLLEQRGAAADHPVRLSCPETEYLKCFICRVL